MSDRLVTLTTDFGQGSSYAAALKGAIFGVNPRARAVDLTHSLPPQDVLAASLFLADVLPYYPDGTIHVVVVDPGVGTGRAILCIDAVRSTMLVPDNGCWTEAVPPREVRKVIRLSDPTFWRPAISPTFHGRDIIAPVAGHLSLGMDPSRLGTIVNEWVCVHPPVPSHSGSVVRGQVVSIDRFGNLISNIRNDVIAGGSRVMVGGHIVKQFVKTYGDAELGSLVALIGSSGRLEFAVVNGSAAMRLGVGVGAAVEVVAGE